MSNAVMTKEQFLDKYASVQAGELILFMAGEFDSYRDVALVRVLRDADMSEWADHYIQTHKINRWPLEPVFHGGDFIKFLEMHGVVEELKYRNLDVANDTDCTLASPMPDSYVDESESQYQSLPYEAEELAFDPTAGEG